MSGERERLRLLRFARNDRIKAPSFDELRTNGVFKVHPHPHYFGLGFIVPED